MLSTKRIESTFYPLSFSIPNYQYIEIDSAKFYDILLSMQRIYASRGSLSIPNYQYIEIDPAKL